MTFNGTQKKAWTALILIIMCQTGCATQTQGTFVASTDVTRLFYEDRILSDFNYYYDGSEMLPRAVIGVRKDYRLKSDFWQPLELSRKKMQEWQRQARAEKISGGSVGAEILSSDGTRVAVWYSYDAQSAWRYAEVKEDKTMIIYPPSHLDFEPMVLPKFHPF